MLKPTLAAICFFALISCGGAQTKPVIDDVDVPTVIRIDDTHTPISPEEPNVGQSQPDPVDRVPPELPTLGLVADEDTSGYYYPVDVEPVADTGISAIVFSESGLIVLPKTLINGSLNDPGAIQDLLLRGLGESFPQAANWTFRALNNSDEISWVLWWRYGFYVPSYSPYGVIVVGDEDAFLGQLYEAIFGDPLEPDTGTYDMISDIVTASSSVTTTSSSH